MYPIHPLELTNNMSQYKMNYAINNNLDQSHNYINDYRFINRNTNQSNRINNFEPINNE
jgi:hypothetical protein